MKTTPEMRKSIDAVTKLAVEMGTEFLRVGIFTPFGLARHTDGNIDMINVDLTPAEQQVETLVSMLKERAKNSTVELVAVVQDVIANHPMYNEKSDAIIVETEHRENAAVTVVYHYQLENGELQMLDPYRMWGDLRFFNGT